MMDGGMATIDVETRQRRDAVKSRLHDAALTLHAMPYPRELDRLDRLQATWPHVPQDFWTAYAAAAARRRPPEPTGEQLDRLDQVLAWILVLDLDARRLVGAWMLGADWAEICRRFRIGRTTGWARLNAALDRLAEAMGEAG
jgi:hypothetical protein